jgi:monofunctional biosynthetic peptidoglycan transglycosylase
VAISQGPKSVEQDPVRKKRRLRTWAVALGIALVFPIATGAFLWFSLPDVTSLRKENPRATAFMLYREEQSRKQGKRPRRIWYWTPLSRISPYLIHAVLIAEDDKFFQHRGFDWESMREALEKDIRRKRFAFGGSTISQQLAKNLYLSPRKSPIRKLREAMIAYRLERSLSKRRILELYLNVIEWGDGIYGAEAAARMYFGCSAAELSPWQAIRLASVLPNPIRYSPLDSTRRWLRKKRVMLAERMRKRNLISEEQFREVLSNLGLQPPELLPSPEPPIPAEPKEDAGSGDSSVPLDGHGDLSCGSFFGTGWNPAAKSTRVHSGQGRIGIA